jgi:4'-phosphopantetheinyl transferase
VIAYLTQLHTDLPAQTETWLSAAELAELAALRIASRRLDWLIGRWTAKCLLQATVAASAEFRSIQIAPARGRPPVAVWPGSAGAWPLSISHCGGRAVAALDTERPTPLGVDLERIAERPPVFANDYFTAAELVSLRSWPEAQAERVTAIWCVKEAALKALGLGLTVDTRAINVGLDDGRAGPGGWRGLEAAPDPTRLPPAPDGTAQTLRGWWCRREADVLAIVPGTAPVPPAGWPVELLPLRPQESVA